MITTVNNENMSSTDLILVFVGVSCGSFESLIHSRSRWMCKVGEYEQAAMCL